MTVRKKYSIFKPLRVIIALVVAGAVLILSVSAVGNRDKKKIADVQITVQDIDGQQYISKENVLSLISKYTDKKLTGQSTNSLDLTALEKHLEEDKWIKQAVLFIDNQNVLRISVEPVNPVARIFDSKGLSFYLADDGDILPYNSRVSKRLPLFTGFDGNVKKLDKEDSALIDGVLKMSDYIVNNDFWMAQIDQIDIDNADEFLLIPKMGNQVIRFGDAEDCDVKFSKLLAFYRQVQNKIGWNRYRSVDLRFRDQIVAERRDASQIRADSIAALRIMKKIIADARKKSSDSTVIQLPEKNISVPKEFKEESVDRSSEVISEEIPETYRGKISSSSVKELSPKEIEKPATGAETRSVSEKIGKDIGPAPVNRPDPVKTERSKNIQPAGKTVSKPVTEVTGNKKKSPKAVMPPKKDN